MAKSNKNGRPVDKAFEAERNHNVTSTAYAESQAQKPSGNVISAFGKSPAKIKTFNSSPNNVEHRLGFINRDSAVTERVRTPMVVNPLGRDFWREARAFAEVQPNTAAFPPKSDVVTISSSGSVVPGIMSLDVEFAPAAYDAFGNNITTDIFLSKWIASRYLDNMVKNWQQGDIAAVETSLMMIRAYVEHARRCLRVMRDVYQDSTNLYYSPVAMMHALGFYMPEQAIRNNYENYWRYFNQSVIGLLNSCKWISGCPGHYRWASLFCDVYKDNPAKTRYTQMFVLRPHTMYTLLTLEDGWHLRKLRDMHEYFTIDATGDPSVVERNPQGFWQFLKDLNSLIRQTFYDDSVQDMLATMNAIDMRSSRQDTALGTISNLEFDYMDFESQNYDFPITFDMQMLVAIHNATICHGLNHSDITIDPATGNIKESFWGPSTTNDFLRLAPMPKIVNLPTFTPTQGDIFNATQWTVTSDIGNYCQQPAESNSRSKKAKTATKDTNAEIMLNDDPNFRAWTAAGFLVGTFGTDVIVDARYHYRNANTSMAISPTSPAAFTSAPLNQLFEIPIERDYSRAAMISACNNLAMAQQFAFAPTIYAADNNEDNGWFARGVFNQSEVYFIGDRSTLVGLHQQFLKNFWGFPMFPGAEGTANFSIMDTETSPIV